MVDALWRKQIKICTHTIVYACARIVAPYLTFVVITTYNQRCVFKIYPQKYHLQIFSAPINYLNVYIRNRIRSATVLWILAPYITTVWLTTPPTTLCRKNIEPKNPIQFINISSLCTSPKISPFHFPYWWRYTFLSHLTTKSKISVRWIKKLVAATDGVYASIQFYNLAIVSVTAGTVCPAAIYHDYAIYNPTNNAVSKKYRTQNQNKFNAYTRFRCYNNIQPTVFLLNIETPPQTHPQFLAKPSANSLIFNHPLHRLRGIFDEKRLDEISPTILLIGGDTPFYLISQRNQRFLPHPQKNWSPLRTACMHLYNFITSQPHL